MIFLVWFFAVATVLAAAVTSSLAWDCHSAGDAFAVGAWVGVTLVALFLFAGCLAKDIRDRG